MTPSVPAPCSHWNRIWLASLAGLCIGLPLAGTPRAQAQDLRIGERTELTMDPHYLWAASNIGYYREIYGALVDLDQKDRAVPDLAESWKAVDPTTWEFKLRKDAVFSDGTPVTAADIVASFKRAMTLKAAVPYAGALRGITKYEAIDEHTVRFTTAYPDPIITHQVSQIAIIPQHLAETATTGDFNAGKGIIGAGPYKVLRYVPGDRLEVERNEHYFGKKPYWQHVTFRFLSDDAARVAALMGGDVDVIDSIPPNDVNRLKNSPDFHVFTGPSDRVMFLAFDTHNDRSPQVTGADGEPLDRNPLKDIRVRKAFILAVDRNTLAQKVMAGLAVPIGQAVPPGFGGYDPALPPPPFDPAQAKKLLAAAGYPNGFGITVTCTNDRYINDSQVCQALGQMFARIGLKMKVSTMPKSVFFPKAIDPSGPTFSLSMMGWGSQSSGEADSLVQVLHTIDKAKGYGAWNFGHYSNPQVDALVEKSADIMDDKQRWAVEAQAMKVAMDDAAVVPLYVQSVVVATRKGFDYSTFAEDWTIPSGVTPERK